MPGPDDCTEQQVEGRELVRKSRVLAFWDGGFTSRELPAEGAVLFGRGADCDVALGDASVSRHHAVLHVGEATSLEDLGSSNGTCMGARRLAPHVRTAVVPGEVILLGRVRVLLDLTVPRPPPTGEPSATGAMAEVERLLALVAPSPLAVLVCGETGVGKERAAERIHGLSRGASGPFVRLNCAAIPEQLLESELFGHERGAFTGALQPKPGLIEAAHGGTLFLDEVAELPPAAQAKLLRVLEAGEVTRVGSVTPRRIDVRFVAATNRDLAARVATGAFRQDLYYRLNGVTVSIPPLRERRAEIAPLAAGFAAAAARSLGRSPPVVGAEALAALEAHDWPGNIRELGNAVGRAVAVCEGGVIAVAHLPDEIVRRTAPVARAGEGDTARGPVVDAERRRVLDALERAAGHQGRAAELLGISRRTLLHRLDALHLPRPRKGHTPAKR
jgi:DNA-binding NtrC family response regulator